jgi:hypothetical protein
MLAVAHVWGDNKKEFSMSEQVGYDPSWYATDEDLRVFGVLILEAPNSGQVE